MIDNEKRDSTLTPPFDEDNSMAALASVGISNEEIRKLEKLDINWPAFTQFIKTNAKPVPRNSDQPNTPEQHTNQITKIADVLGVTVGTSGLASLARNEMAEDDVMEVGFKLLQQKLNDQIVSGANIAEEIETNDICILPPSLSVAISQSQNFDMPNLDGLEGVPEETKQEIQKAMLLDLHEAAKTAFITREMRNAKVLFIPVNNKTINRPGSRASAEDNDTSKHSGSSHWEMLCMRKDEAGKWTSHYYDTLNMGDATDRGRAIANKFQTLLGEFGAPLSNDSFKVHQAPLLTVNSCGTLNIGIIREIAGQFIKAPHTMPGDVINVRRPEEERTEIAEVILKAMSCHRSQSSHDIIKPPPLLDASETLIDSELNLPVDEIIQAQQLHEQVEAHREIQKALGLDDEQLKELIEQDKNIWHNHEMKKEASTRYAEHNPQVLRGFELYADTMSELNRKADFNDFERVGEKALEKISSIHGVKKYEKAFQQYVKDDIQDQSIIKKYEKLTTLNGMTEEQRKTMLVELANALDHCVDQFTFQRHKIKSLHKNIELVDGPTQHFNTGQVLLFVDRQEGCAYFKKTGAKQTELRLARVPLSNINQANHLLTPGNKYDNSIMAKHDEGTFHQAKTIKAH